MNKKSILIFCMTLSVLTFFLLNISSVSATTYESVLDVYTGWTWDNDKNYSALWNEYDSNLFYTNGKVGIGTTTPSTTLEVGSGVFSVNATSGNVGIGTTTPNYPLQVNGSNGGISIYAQYNISATDYITRTSVFDKNKNVWDYVKDSDYFLTDNKINHKKFYGYRTYNLETTDYDRPEINLVCADETILENYTHIEKVCEYKKKFLSDNYEYVCEDVPEQRTRNKQICSMKNQCEYILVEDETYFKQVCKDVEVCEDEVKEICKDETTYPYTKIKTEEGVSVGSEIDVLRQGIYELKIENDLMKQDLCSLGIARWC